MLARIYRSRRGLRDDPDCLRSWWAAPRDFQQAALSRPLRATLLWHRKGACPKRYLRADEHTERFAQEVGACRPSTLRGRAMRPSISETSGDRPGHSILKPVKEIHD